MKTVPLPLPEPQAKAVKEASRRTGLSQADVMRQSIQIGLPLFLARLCPEPDYLHPPPLPPGTMERVYATQARDENEVERRAARAIGKKLRRALKGKRPEDV
jgi:hypothetical protein